MRPFFLGRPIFRGELLVLGRVIILQKPSVFWDSWKFPFHGASCHFQSLREAFCCTQFHVGCVETTPAPPKAVEYDCLSGYSHWRTLKFYFYLFFGGWSTPVVKVDGATPKRWRFVRGKISILSRWVSRKRIGSLRPKFLVEDAKLWNNPLRIPTL